MPFDAEISAVAPKPSFSFDSHAGSARVRSDHDLKKLVLLGSALTLAVPACGWSALRTIKPEKAVIAAAKAGSEGVGGVFKMVVVAVGHQRGKVFLNSQSDYRDPRNLTIAMSDATAEKVGRKAGVTDASADRPENLCTRASTHGAHRFHGR